MIISHLDGNGITNFDNCCRIERHKCMIWAYMVDGSEHTIAKCATEEEARKFLERIEFVAERS